MEYKQLKKILGIDLLETKPDNQKQYHFFEFQGENSAIKSLIQKIWITLSIKLSRYIRKNKLYVYFVYPSMHKPVAIFENNTPASDYFFNNIVYNL